MLHLQCFRFSSSKYPLQRYSCALRTCKQVCSFKPIPILWIQSFTFIKDAFAHFNCPSRVPCAKETQSKSPHICSPFRITIVDLGEAGFHHRRSSLVRFYELIATSQAQEGLDPHTDGWEENKMHTAARELNKPIISETQRDSRLRTTKKNLSKNNALQNALHNSYKQ